jgi:hypothetical protein
MAEKAKSKTTADEKKKESVKDEPVAETAPVTALTKVDEKRLAKEAEANWAKVTEEFRNRRRQAAADILQYRYDVGIFANDLVESRALELGKKIYGDKTVEHLGEAIAESQSTLHTCMRFARKVDVKELEYFKAQEWPWRAVSSLVTVEDPAAYKKLKEDFESERFKNSDELKTAAKAINDKARAAGTRDKRGGSPATLSVIKSFEVSCNQVTTQLMPNFMTAVKDFAKDSAKMESNVVEKTEKAIKEAKKSLDALKKMIERLDEVVKGAGV